jgi:hypothetical protein
MNVEKVWGERYTLGSRYLYIRMNVEKVWGERYTLVRVIYTSKGMSKKFGVSVIH